VDIRVAIEYIRLGGYPRKAWHDLISLWLNKLYNQKSGGDESGRNT
jgi:hypothetical protein